MSQVTQRHCLPNLHSAQLSVHNSEVTSARATSTSKFVGSERVIGLTRYRPWQIRSHRGVPMHALRSKGKKRLVGSIHTPTRLGLTTQIIQILYLNEDYDVDVQLFVVSK